MAETENKIVWVIDPIHSIIRFESRYLLLTAVSGRFPEIEGRLTTCGDDFDKSSIQLVIYTNSLTTLNDSRDKHLKSPDFFDTEKYPKIIFHSTEVQATGSQVKVKGELTIRDVTREIEFDAVFAGLRKDPYGNEKAGFEMKTTLNRKDFNITWNNYFDQNGVLLSDDIDIFCDIQLLKVD